MNSNQIIFEPEILILCSGQGRLVEPLLPFLKDKNSLHLITDRPCLALEKAKTKWIISSTLIPRPEWSCLKPNFFGLHSISTKNLRLVVLAGFLSILPIEFFSQIKAPIINSHPSLLPEFGGKGMWGQHVHKKVIASKKKFSGCSIHFVNEGIDSGEIIAQARVPIFAADTDQTLANKILALEKELLPLVVRSLLSYV